MMKNKIRSLSEELLFIQNNFILVGATYKYSVCEVTYHVVCHFVRDSVFLPEYKSNNIKKYYLFVFHFLPE